jgi:hypothetical protein
MTVGLPGTGIGGLFYLINALAMPVVEIIRNLRGRRETGGWRVAVSQFSLGLAMFSVLAATGLITDYALGLSQKALETYLPAEYGGGHGFSLGVVPTFITLGVLGTALLFIEIAGAVLIWTNPNDLRKDVERPHATTS